MLCVLKEAINNSIFQVVILLGWEKKQNKVQISKSNEQLLPKLPLNAQATRALWTAGSLRKLLMDSEFPKDSYICSYQRSHKKIFGGIKYTKEIPLIKRKSESKEKQKAKNQRK